MFMELPAEVEAVFRGSRVCELSTLGKDGTSISSPMAGRFPPEYSRYLSTASKGSPFKVFNIRCDSRAAKMIVCLTCLRSASTGRG